MKNIIGLILLVASTQAIDHSNLKERTMNRQAIYPSHTEDTERDHLKINPKFKVVQDKAELKSKPERPSNQTRIVGGGTAYYGQFPWQAAILQYGQIHCGAVLVSDEWVFTTAACVFGLDEFVIVIGAIHLHGVEDIDKREIPVYSGNVMMHPGFNNHDFHYNVGLVRLPYRVGFNEHVRPISLPNTCIAVSWKGAECVFSGWGSVTGDGGDRSSDLMYTVLVGTYPEDCAEYGDYFTENDACASASRGYSPCYGDIGGPVVLGSDEPLLVGVLSVIPSEGCLAGRPLVLSYLLNYEYLQWIQDNTGIPLVC